jgi:hypothetical protein
LPSARRWSLQHAYRANRFIQLTGAKGRLSAAAASSALNGCYERAGEICGKRGYDILSQNEEVGHVASVQASTYGGSGFASDTRNRTMIIKCKGD